MMASSSPVPEQLFPTLSEADIKHRSEAERRLPNWLSHPYQFQAGNLNLFAQNIEDFGDYIDQELINYIKINLNIHKLFPVQKCLIPLLTKQFRSRFVKRPNDICVSSPTGSGKTLAYVIPIVNHLKQSLTRKLRAAVVLPTRDLAQQVYKSFHQVCQPTHLRCALANDDSQVFFRRVTKYSTNAKSYRLSKSIESSALMSHNIYPEKAILQDDYASTIDILVSTPGTLVDLLQNSRGGFTLKDLEILVIDEADRLMLNHKHDWLNAIEHAVSQRFYECPCKNPDFDHVREMLQEECSNYFTANGCNIRNLPHSRYIHKLLFSATLSSDPQILTHMNLFQPRLVLATKPSLTSTKIRNSLGTPASTPGGSPTPQSISTPAAVSSRSELLATTAIPDELDERMFITETKDKLYVIWYLMHELKYKKVLCFTSEKRKSYELFLFLNEIASIRAVNFSSDNKPELRQKYINEFKKGQVEVIVATDLCARGIDIDGVEYVISYDMPQSGIVYAHRVGRTARAGNKGCAITLVDSKQLVQFKKIIQAAHNKPNSMKLSEVVEEMKISHMNQKDERRDHYIKTYENYKDKLNMMKLRIARHNKNKQ